jgi:hypothetical protein
MMPTSRLIPNFMANRRASEIWPFCCSPSPMNAYVQAPFFRIFRASAAPIAAENPCPRLPVFHSTPGTLVSTWPAKALPARRKPSRTCSCVTNPYVASVA